MKTEGYAYSRGTFIGKDGYEIFFQSWESPKPRLIMAVCHGLGEHSGRYLNLVKDLQGRGVSIYAIDHRGHGRSAGRRGHVSDFMDYVRDLRHYADYVREDLEELPFVLFGHSLGAVIACAYALEYPRDLGGIILSGPGFHAGRGVPAWKHRLAGVMGRVLPGFSMSNTIGPSMLTHDEGAIDEYENDLLVHDRVTARWFTEFTGTCRTCLERAQEITAPLLVLHGGDDGLAPLSGSKEFFAGVSSQKKELCVFDGMYHEVVNEKDHRLVTDVIARFLYELIAPPRPKKKKAAGRARR